MDLYSFQNIKAEKEKAIMKYRRMQKMTILFRFVEFCIFAIAFSRFSAHFPQALNFSGDHFKEILVSLISPRFLFVVGNAIVVILYLKSKKSSTDDNEEMNNKQSISVSGEEEDVVPEKRRKIEQAPVSSLEKNCPAPEDEKPELYDDDEKKCLGHSFFHGNNEPMNKQRSEEEEEETPASRQQMHRSQSESWIVSTVPERTKDLTRSATVGCRKSEERAVETEEMSSEEFRRKVEDFIARQQRLLREEEFLASEE
ncbi:unnamed protein product [Cuscuta epithymum]|uniref:DUF4408 domain-containing protein n=1 Tax=Cuscuta epithymum TaxID=186058 RepID=A0AAV0E6M6_9ASTE|nr:unnamed protein product [Cuscuta epithymum]